MYRNEIKTFVESPVSEIVMILTFNITSRYSHTRARNSLRALVVICVSICPSIFCAGKYPATCASVSMKMHLCLGAELCSRSLTVFNVSRDAYRRRVMLRDCVSSGVHIQQRSLTHTARSYASHKIPSPLPSDVYFREKP